MADSELNTASVGEVTENPAPVNVVEDKQIPEDFINNKAKKEENKSEGEEQKEEEDLERKEIQEDNRSMCSNSSSHTSSSSSPSSTSSEASSSPSAQDAPRIITMEDSDKKYGVVEPTKPKTWLAAYNSLAPRTRQTVRTAAIAVVSALALVAIFHLARLAEHPVTENVIGESSAVNQKEPGAHTSGADLVMKSQDGKVFIPSGSGADWRGGQKFAEEVAAAGGVNPVSPVQDMLARSRPAPGRKMRPILNIPMDRNILAEDIERVRKLQKAHGRPANSTEVQKTLDLVKRTVEADRKELKSKSLRLWSPGEAPLRVLLVTTWRSGSTFLGQVLANHPAVFHHYEPFSPRGVRQVRSGRDAFQAQQLLHRLLDCQFAGQEEYLNYTRSHPEDMLGHNMVVWDSCHRGPNVNTCYNATFLSRACQMFPIQLVKTVRLRLNLTQLFLNDEKMNVKVVFLVRDPRATMSSRYNSVSWCSDKPDCSSPEVLCSDLQGDLKVATALRQIYPERFTMIKYEDLASKPHDEIRRLMDFIGMEYSPKLAQYVEEHTQEDVNNPWSTRRKSSDRVSMWKKQLPLQEIHTIQNACESVLKTLEYEIVGQ